MPWRVTDQSSFVSEGDQVRCDCLDPDKARYVAYLLNRGEAAKALLRRVLEEAVAGYYRKLRFPGQTGREDGPPRSNGRPLPDELAREIDGFLEGGE
jgi:hypothetical protein